MVTRGPARTWLANQIYRFRAINSERVLPFPTNDQTSKLVTRARVVRRPTVKRITLDRDIGTEAEGSPVRARDT
ncbi:hypothetical protein EVAR_18676_1 [Eumeta japonica]|uniref:Uncharacterized protein n=1 Tax=Eumeta variegata TaxID=151549 RepID=A0A4C1U6P4_EUMVA|nr:hypothetical protein EVAR_18676_1 [Eumeta japonica]